MKGFISFIVTFCVVFGAMMMERYTAERDFVKQLSTSGRTDFIFHDNIQIKSATDVEIIKENK